MGWSDNHIATVSVSCNVAQFVLVLYIEAHKWRVVRRRQYFDIRAGPARRHQTGGLRLYDTLTAHVHALNTEQKEPAARHADMTLEEHAVRALDEQARLILLAVAYVLHSTNDGGTHTLFVTIAVM